MYILTKEINEEEYIFYLMDNVNNPLKAKIEKTNSKNIIKLSKKYAKENNVKNCEINTLKARKDYGY